METHQDPARVISEIEYTHGFKPGTLASKKVTKFISKARGTAIVQLRGLGLSFQEIGKHLNRDHTSIIRLNRITTEVGKKSGKVKSKRG